MVIDLASLEKFKKSDNNVKITVGDVLIIPKKPDYISVLGEVFNQTAIVYKPGKVMDYYLEQAGGATQDADKGRLYVIKANGSIISGEGKWFYDIRNEVLEPGDTILVPQLIERADYLEAIRSIVDIAYKTATAAGVIITTTKALSN
jgi:polysaccharide export outer membrane protein